MATRKPQAPSAKPPFRTITCVHTAAKANGGVWSHPSGNVSVPGTIDRRGSFSVKAIDNLGNELMVAKEIKP